MGVEIILLEKHGIHGIENLKRCGDYNRRVDLTTVIENRICDHCDIEESETDHGKSECLKLHIATKKGGVYLAAMIEVYKRVSSVPFSTKALRGCPAREKVGGHGLQEGEYDAGGHQVEILQEDNTE